MTQGTNNADQKAIVTASSLNLRPEPSTRKPSVGKIKRGTKVTILDTVNAWYFIETRGKQAYVHGDYLLLLDEKPQIGFLHENENLRQVPLQPANAELISTTADHSRTERKIASTWNKNGGLLQVLGSLIKVEHAAAVAIVCVESSGEAFNADRRMIIRFENHIFYRKWGKEHPEIFHQHFRFNKEKAWQKHGFRKDADGRWLSFHGNQSREWEAFELAFQLHEQSALESISMGMPQIMGFNHARIGYESPRNMFTNFQADIRYQLIGLFDFLRGPNNSSPMMEAIKRQQWEQFASYYNGPGQAARYGELIQSHYELFHGLREG